MSYKILPQECEFVIVDHFPELCLPLIPSRRMATHLVYSNIFKVRISLYLTAIMRSLWSWLSGTQAQSCEEHKGGISHVCCNDSCFCDRYICNVAGCADKHKGHAVLEYQKFKNAEALAAREIRYRQSIEDSISEYYDKYIAILQEVFDREKNRMLDLIDRKFFSRTTAELYRRHKDEVGYSSLLPDLQPSVGMELSDTIRKKVKEKEKKMKEFGKKSFLAEGIFLDESILMQVEKLREAISISKIERIKAVLPFQCELTLKFQASKNKFLTHNLFQRGIRGPILLIAESYKGRSFGGFSPNMFPREERYEADMRCKSFLFSLDDRVILPLKEESKKYSIRGGSNLWFGRGDLAISDECHKANISWAEIGRAYEVPRGLHGNPSEWLAGCLYFRVLEYEIFQVEIARSFNE